MLPKGGTTSVSTKDVGADNNPFLNVAFKGDEDEDSGAEDGPLSLRHSGAISKFRRKELVAFIAAITSTMLAYLSIIFERSFRAQNAERLIHLLPKADC